MVPKAGLEPARACGPRDFKSLVSTIPPLRQGNLPILSRCAKIELEAPPRFGLGMKVLQTSALPLGYGATSLKFLVGTVGLEPTTPCL